MTSSFDNATHVRNLANSLNVQRKNGAFCDVLLKVAGNVLPTHSCILTACSPYFKELICGEYGTGPPRLLGVPLELVLDLPGLVAGRTSELGGDDSGLEKLEVLILDLLEYIYTGKIDLTEEGASLVGRLADAFMLEGLSSLIGDYVNSLAARTKDNDADAPSSRNAQRRTKPKHRQRKAPPKKIAEPVDLSAVCCIIKGKSEEKSHVSDDLPEPKIRILRSRKREAAVSLELRDEDGDSSENVDVESPMADPNFAPPKKSKQLGRSTKKCTFKCGECEFTSDDQRSIRDHKKIHNRSRAYVCVSCGFFTGRCGVLLAHLMTSNHPEKECSLCGFVAGDKNSFRSHLQRHDHRKLPFFCQLCDMRCRARSMLEKHVAKHADDRPFVCDICGNGFKLKQGLNTHMQTHTASKNFACSVCPFRTSYKTNLQMHVRKHNGSMFRCTHESCTFQSNSKHNLQSHVLTHAKLKPFLCPVCGQKFAQERNLRRHSKIHDPEAKLLQCDACQQFTTTRRDRLAAHVKKCGTAAVCARGPQATAGTENYMPNPNDKHAKKSNPVIVASGDGRGNICVGNGSGHHDEQPLMAPTDNYTPIEHKICHGPPIVHAPIVNNPSNQFEKPMMDYAPRMYWFP